MKYFRKLVGSKCYLSPMRMEDAEKYTEWLNNLEVCRNLKMITTNISLHAEREFLPTLIKSHTYSIIDLEGEELIGNCGLHDIDHLNRIADTGIFIGNKDYWNRGYGEEALRLLLDYGFKYLNLRNIMLVVYSFNTRAYNCYKKVGFQEIGRRRKALQREMKEHDLIYMDILNEEFVQSQGK